MKPGTRARAAGATDVGLVTSIAQGDLEALGILFDRYEPDVRRYLGRMGVHARDTDDLVQSTFLEVVGAAPRFDPSLCARAWLLGIATMMVRRHNRSLARAHARVVAWAARMLHPQEPPTPADALESDRQMARFRQAVNALSPAKREVFILVVVEELSGKEVARALDIPVNTVWTRLHHARIELRAALSEVSP